MTSQVLFTKLCEITTESIVDVMERKSHKEGSRSKRKTSLTAVEKFTIVVGYEERVLEMSSQKQKSTAHN